MQTIDFPVERTYIQQRRYPQIAKCSAMILNISTMYTSNWRNYSNYLYICIYVSWILFRDFVSRENTYRALDNWIDEEIRVLFSHIWFWQIPRKYLQGSLREFDYIYICFVWKGATIYLIGLRLPMGRGCPNVFFYNMCKYPVFADRAFWKNRLT